MNDLEQEYESFIENSISYRAYDTIKTITWMYLLHFILYSLILFFDTTFITLPIFLCGILVLIVSLVIPLTRMRSLYKDEKLRKEILSVIITQLIMLGLDLIYGILYIVVFETYSVALIDELFIYYSMVLYYVRYILWGYVIFESNQLHSKFAKQFSYKNRTFYSSFALYPLIGLKLILFNSDFNLIIYSQSGVPLVDNFTSNNVLIFTAHLIFIGINVIFAIESYIKMNNTTKAIKNEK